ncbi:MAG: GAP family protein [Mycobacterium sp.]|nr:GAP family protein [Mycobacterium sp.]
MWHEVLVLALLVSLNPVLIAFTLLVISRPRTVQNLLAFWVGSFAVNVSAFLVALTALHLVPSFAGFAHRLATPDPRTSVEPLQVASGAAALILAAVIGVRLWMRNRTKQPVAPGVAGDESVDAVDTGAFTSPPGRLTAVIARVTSAVKRQLARARAAWEGGSLWMSMLMGLGYFAELPLVLLIGTIVVASGTSIATQIAAVVAFVLVMLGIVELALVGYVISPQKTQAVLQPLHDWSAAHRKQILIALLVVVGIWLTVKGFGIA